jgi:Rrf2 family transcriptional regulator, nitric oxide-sensitive transcriptional repressor
MNLTVQTDYAFRTLMFLAVRAPESATIREIADQYRISRAHLMVLVHRLGGLGLVENTRGRKGGVRLGRPASKIRLDEIVRAIEPGFFMAECFRPEAPECLVTAPCRLHGILDEALAAWFAVLHRYTLSDLVDRNPALAELLKMPAPECAPPA